MIENPLSRMKLSKAHGTVSTVNIHMKVAFAAVHPEFVQMQLLNGRKAMAATATCMGRYDSNCVSFRGIDIKYVGKSGVTKLTHTTGMSLQVILKALLPVMYTLGLHVTIFLAYGKPL